MDFQDFSMFLGNLGVETDHPPKMCAGLAAGAHPAGHAPRGDLPHAEEAQQRDPRGDILRGDEALEQVRHAPLTLHASFAELEWSEGRLQQVLTLCPKLA